MEEGLSPDLEPPSEDVITAVEYSMNGDYLATGDRNGRITILKLDIENKAKNKEENWLPYFQFQSHEPEFDFLKSIELEGKINQIKFCHAAGNNNLLLSTNDKTIKLWKIVPKSKYLPKAVDNYEKHREILLPQKQSEDSNNCSEPKSSVEFLQAINKRTFSNAHSYHINSLSVNNDQESFISADDLRINLWKLDSNHVSFNLVDIKPDNMEELTEVITSVQSHPIESNSLIYSSSRGAIKVCDLRQSAIVSHYAKVYMDHTPANTNKSFITDILNSISDIQYSCDGRFIVARDYLTVKIWDVRVESRPVKSISLHDHLRPMLYDLYTSDTIFDKFEISCSYDGKGIATGSYNNQLKVYYQDGRGLRTIDLPKIVLENGELNSNLGLSPNIPQEKTVEESLEKVKLKDITGSSSGKLSKSTLQHHHPKGNFTEPLKLDEKVLHVAWHPLDNTVAVAGKSGLCLYKV